MKLDNFVSMANKHLSLTFNYSGKQEFFSAGFMKSGKCIKNVSFSHARILYLLSGSGIYTDHLGKRFALKPGDMVYRAANQIHSLKRYNTDEWLEFFILFPNYISESFLRSKVISSSQNYFSPGFPPQIFTKIKTLIDSAGFSTPIECAETIIKAQEIFIYLLKSRKYSLGQKTERSVIERAQLYLTETLEKREAITNIAKKLGAGYESFRKTFKEKTGLPPRDYRIHKRIEKAQVLLLNQELNISEIAEILGYQDTAAFVKQFKKISLCTPKQFRSKNM